MSAVYDFAGTPWENARSFDDLCELTAQFLEGKIDGFTQTAIDDEADGLAALLAKANRAGFLTDCSQPGETGQSWKQRAFVSGAAREDLAMRLYCLGLEYDLITFVWPVTDPRYLRLVGCVNENNEPCLWLGASFSLEEYEALHPSVSDDLATCWSVEILDPSWGRNDYLWPALEAAISGSPNDYSTENGVDGGDFVY